MVGLPADNQYTGETLASYSLEPLKAIDPLPAVPLEQSPPDVEAGRSQNVSVIAHLYTQPAGPPLGDPVPPLPFLPRVPQGRLRTRSTGRRLNDTPVAQSVGFAATVADRAGDREALRQGRLGVRPALRSLVDGAEVE